MLACSRCSRPFFSRLLGGRLVATKSSTTVIRKDELTEKQRDEARRVRKHGVNFRDDVLAEEQKGVPPLSRVGRSPGRALETLTEGDFHLQNLDLDGYERTSVSVGSQSVASDFMYISGISQMGFKLSIGEYLGGAVLMFPKTPMSWKILTVDEITPDSVAIFTKLVPKLEIVVIGVGDYEHVAPVRTRIAHIFGKEGIGLEVMETRHAASTFNYLASEGRYVAAGLLPPQSPPRPAPIDLAFNPTSADAHIPRAIDHGRDFEVMKDIYDKVQPIKKKDVEQFMSSTMNELRETGLKRNKNK